MKLPKPFLYGMIAVVVLVVVGIGVAFFSDQLTTTVRISRPGQEGKVAADGSATIFQSRAFSGGNGVDPQYIGARLVVRSLPNATVVKLWTLKRAGQWPPDNDKVRIAITGVGRKDGKLSDNCDTVVRGKRYCQFTAIFPYNEGRGTQLEAGGRFTTSVTVTGKRARGTGNRVWLADSFSIRLPERVEQTVAVASATPAPTQTIAPAVTPAPVTPAQVRQSERSLTEVMAEQGWELRVAYMVENEASQQQTTGFQTTAYSGEVVGMRYDRATGDWVRDGTLPIQMEQRVNPQGETVRVGSDGALHLFYFDTATNQTSAQAIALSEQGRSNEITRRCRLTELSRDQNGTIYPNALGRILNQHGQCGQYLGDIYPVTFEHTDQADTLQYVVQGQPQAVGHTDRTLIRRATRPFERAFPGSGEKFPNWSWLEQNLFNQPTELIVDTASRLRTRGFLPNSGYASPEQLEVLKLDRAVPSDLEAVLAAQGVSSASRVAGSSYENRRFFQGRDEEHYLITGRNQQGTDQLWYATLDEPGGAWLTSLVVEDVQISGLPGVVVYESAPTEPEYFLTVAGATTYGSLRPVAFHVLPVGQSQTQLADLECADWFIEVDGVEQALTAADWAELPEAPTCASLDAPVVTPAPTATPTVTPTATPLPATATPTATPAPTATPTPEPVADEPAPDPVGLGSDIEVTTTKEAQASVGQRLTWVSQVKNLGPDTASPVRFIFMPESQLEAGATILLNGQDAGSNCTETTNGGRLMLITCELGTLKASDQVGVEVSASPVSSVLVQQCQQRGVASVVARAIGYPVPLTVDPNTGNNGGGNTRHSTSIQCPG